MSVSVIPQEDRGYQDLVLVLIIKRVGFLWLGRPSVSVIHQEGRVLLASKAFGPNPHHDKQASSTLALLLLRPGPHHEAPATVVHAPLHHAL